MNSAKESNVKSIAVIAFVSVLLFGIFYYLITDVSGSTNLKAEKKVDAQVVAQNFLVDREKPAQQDVKGDSVEKSVFKELSTQKVDTQPKMVLAGSDTNTPESTVPATGSDTIFSMFVVSSLIMFTGIYLLLTQPKNTALAKFEKRLIRELD
ncbi:hypothetical protein COT50_00590 [candidate division WWE3 bacterium CG08_land_8_20_14_0_20_41_10]|uniref:Uncharacterized protein n=1 Tax=candidate division WWE3 bacterium CG08_land_8_20_14_0_20_41_10 TaxID=1975085 RepID=A0A2H0XCL8_UNCKA|nr:MAG: hypothetical protein COT50_00590 [candidate division WWE3 bacterium CG08_land_8_20_14_0_20_41_10]